VDEVRLVIQRSAATKDLGHAAAQSAATVRPRSFVAALLWMTVVAALLFTSGCGKRSTADAVWAGGGRGAGELVYPRAIDYDAKSDTFIVIDRTARVQRYDADGKFINGWRMPEWERGKPVGVSFGPDGNVWIADTHYHRVMVYTPAGELVKQFGQRGSGPGDFELPTDIAFDTAGRVYVGEYGGNDRVQVFDQSGKYLFQFGTFGSEPGQFSRPQSLVFVGDELFITDSCNHRIEVFSADGKYLRSIGKSGSAPGDFRFPYGLFLDREGTLIVTEYGNTRIQRIDTAGKPLAFWGTPGRLPGELAYPWATVADKRGRCVVIDAGNARMQVFHW
jgi:sugar lactone lactonase YvrE